MYVFILDKGLAGPIGLASNVAFLEVRRLSLMAHPRIQEPELAGWAQLGTGYQSLDSSRNFVPWGKRRGGQKRNG